MPREVFKLGEREGVSDFLEVAIEVTEGEEEVGETEEKATLYDANGRKILEVDKEELESFKEMQFEDIREFLDTIGIGYVGIDTVENVLKQINNSDTVSDKFKDISNSELKIQKYLDELYGSEVCCVINPYVVILYPEEI